MHFFYQVGGVDKVGCPINKKIKKNTMYIKVKNFFY